jgi:hypothetical protein
VQVQALEFKLLRNLELMPIAIINYRWVIIPLLKTEDLAHLS